MDEVLSKRIHKIHEECIIIDAHFDLLMYVEMKRSLGYRKVIEDEFLQNFKESGVDVIVCSLYIDDCYLPEMGLKKSLDQISALYSEIDESPDKIVLCTNYNDIVKAKSRKMLAVLLSFEGVDPLTNDLSLLNVFYKLGVRIVGLTWSRRNYAADGCYFSNQAEGKKGGLTPFGVELVKMAEGMGMIIDVSHINDEGFWDVMDLVKHPVIASHSNCRALAGTMRNLTDEQIKAISEKGGVIGMNACASFVSDNENERSVEHLARHADHIAKLAGTEHIGLGFDFCDFLDAVKVRMKPDRRTSDVIAGHKNIYQFTRALIELGYSDKEIGHIIGANFLNLYKKILK